MPSIGTGWLRIGSHEQHACLGWPLLSVLRVRCVCSAHLWVTDQALTATRSSCRHTGSGTRGLALRTQQAARGLGTPTPRGCSTTGWGAAAVASFMAAILTEIYLRVWVKIMRSIRIRTD
eukprot:SAG25_NODE_1664_length_2583_cov_6.139694_2_plen_120_part_00